MFKNKETGVQECYECGFSLSSVSHADLRNLFFTNPVAAEAGPIQEGDKTNWDFYWAVNWWLNKALNAALPVAGWDDDVYSIFLYNDEGEAVLMSAGNDPAEAVELFLKQALRETP